MIDERIESHFWLSEFVRSGTAVRQGLENTPGAMASANIRHVLGPGMQRVRNALGSPVMITSGYRSQAVNAAVGGSVSSQHMVGLAADFIAPQFGLPRSIAKYLVERLPEIRFDQLILEGQWVHISFARQQPRGDVLTAHFMAGGGRPTYTKGLA